MSSYMLQEMGVRAISAVSGFYASTQEYKISKIMQKHQNTMLALSAAQSTNQINRNAIEVEEQFVLASAADQVTAMQDQEAARLSAAAAGASGNSVQSTLHDFHRAAAQKRYSNSKARETAHLQISDDRRQLALSVAAGQNRDIIPRPSAATALLGLGTSLYDTWRQHNPQT